MLKKQNVNLSIKAVITALMLLITLPGFGQNGTDLGTINGNFQLNGQYYFTDTLIGTPEFPEEFGLNSFMYVTYSRNKFRAGMRYEAYMPPLQGYFRTQGAGIAHRFVEYNTDNFSATLGTFYEQFGSGMTFRTYEEWGLGFDNSLDGARVKIRPVSGLEIKGIIGKQRNAFSYNLENLSDGIVRGVDLDVSLNELVPSMDTMEMKIRFGGSFVSRYEKDEDPILVLPENVSNSAARVNLNYKGFNFGAEFAYKINDPSSVNNLIYKPGNALLLQASYSRKGLGISVTAKRIDNMDFRSERAAVSNNLNLNFLPPSTKQHTYRLATLFPYATQLTGEAGLQLEVLYNIKRGSKLGGKYGTNITFNFSRLHGLDKQDPEDPYDGYEAKPFSLGPLFFQDINIEISRKLNKKFKAIFSYLYFRYEETLFTQLTGFKTTEDVSAHVQILELQYKMSRKHALRIEAQHAYTQQEFGSWAMLLAEYTIAPHWFVAVFDEYNYGNAETKKRIHYFTGNFGYNFGDYRITAGYGKQRAGVLCVGGVCRVVPASNGFTISITGSF